MKYLLYRDEKKESDMLLGKQDSQSGRALNDINIDLLSQFLSFQGLFHVEETLSK